VRRLSQNASVREARTSACLLPEGACYMSPNWLPETKDASSAFRYPIQVNWFLLENA
jgi:hypothetical protein